MEFNKETVTGLMARYGLKIRQVGDNFQASWEDLRTTSDLEKCRTLATACDELLAAGYHAGVQLSYLGKDKTRVAYPSLWINKEAREPKAAVPGLQEMVAKAVAQAIAELTKTSMETPKRGKAKAETPAEVF